MAAVLLPSSRLLHKKKLLNLLRKRRSEEAAQPAESGAISIAYLNKMGDNPWFVDEVAGAKAIADELGVEFFNQDLQFDSNLAMTAMGTYIAKGVAGIIIVVPDRRSAPR